MKTYTYEITNIDYSGHDFCGQISAQDAVKIFDEQPKSLTIVITEEYLDEVVRDYDYTIEDIVNDYCDENDILTPTSFDYIVK